MSVKVVSKSLRLSCCVSKVERSGACVASAAGNTDSRNCASPVTKIR